MIPLFSTEQVRQVDSFAIEQLGIPGLVLMENAAASIYNETVKRFSQKSIKLGFVCGRGNNGGDGFAVARMFASKHNYKIVVLYLGSKDNMSPDALINFNILKNLSAQNSNIVLHKFSSLQDVNRLSNCNVIFDALLGTGTKGRLKEPYNDLVKKLNEFTAFKIAIDIPTGVDADTGFADKAFAAGLTVTLGEFKKGLFFGDGYTYSGEIVKGYIGVSSSFFDRYEPVDLLIEPEDAYQSFPLKKKNVHKYSAGKVLTIAGSGELPGAAVLTSKSAFKVGAGASILCIPKSVRKLIHKKLSEVVVKTYNDENTEFLRGKNFNELKERIEWADVVAIGPGLGRDEQTQNTVRKIIANKKNKKIVIDADAIYALNEGKYKNLNLRNCVLTPHHGEFADLIGIKVTELEEDILKYGKSFSVKTKSFLILKGAPTIIFTPDGAALINTTGNPGMAKFGTGDVLTGVLAGFLSQQKSIEKALISGVYVHSLSADLLLKDFTEFGFTADNILNNLPAAIKFLRNSFV